MADTPASTSTTLVVEPHETAVRWALVAAGILVFLLTLLLLVVERPTSTVKVTPLGPTATSSASTVNTETSTTSSASDTLLLGFLGFSALLVLIGAFYGRISKVTLPGGAELDLGALVPDTGNPTDDSPYIQRAAKAVEDLLAEMKPARPFSVVETARATLGAATFAAELIHLCQTQSTQFTGIAAAAELTDAETKQIGKGHLDDRTWKRLAERAVHQVRPS
ncbi:MAG: hypothetical protein ACLQT7_00630 [Candidatus Dormibacteria bacterium]